MGEELSEYTPNSIPMNSLLGNSPNAFDHAAIHPIVFDFEEVSTVAGLGARYLNFGAAGTFTVFEFSLYPVVDVILSVNQLGDLILDSNITGGFFGAGNNVEEKRWALNVGINPINYRPFARYGRFQLVNRGAGTMNYKLNLFVRSM